MKNIIKIGWVALLALSVAIVSCTKDADVSDGYDTTASAPVINEELRNALIELGYNFTDSGELIYDDMVTNTVSLDLSGCSLTSPSGLEVFTSLEVVDLSYNDFGEAFNFNYLPVSIKEINLDGNNDLVSYRNLVSLTSGSVRLTAMEKLTLPLSAMTNFTDIVAFSQNSASKNVTILVADGNGGTSVYSTLREIPDPALKIKLQALYPSIFNTSGYVDLSQTMTETVDLVLTDSYGDLTGVEYVICNPSFTGETGEIYIVADASKNNEISWVKPSAGVKELTLINVSTPNGIYLTDSSYLTMLRLGGNSTIEELDVPSSIYQSSYVGSGIFENELYLVDCDKLASVTMPAAGGLLGKLHVQTLPSLTEFDLTQLKRVHTLVASDLASATIAAPLAISGYLNGWGTVSSNTKVCIALDQNAAGKFSSFIDLYVNAEAEVIDMSSYYKINN